MRFFSSQENSEYEKEIEMAIAMENSSKTVNVDGESMKVAFLTDTILMNAGLVPVTNPIFFEKGNVPTEDGLFSEVIFGTTSKERNATHAYIELKKQFFHPYVYETLKALGGGIDKCCAGEGAWIVNSNGDLEEIKDSDDIRYNEYNTGMDWFIANFGSIKFKQNTSMIRKERIKLIESLSKEELLITKFVVIPVIYRDVDFSSGQASVPEINKAYQKLIQLSNSILQNTGEGYYSNKLMFSMQTTLVSIRRLGQSLIEKKNGHFHQAILGKSITHGARAVISVPSLNYVEKPEDMIVDILHTGVPLAKCCELGYPFMSKWVVDFFQRTFEGKKTITAYIKDKKGNTTIEEIPIDDQLEYFTKEFIDKQMKKFIRHFGGRFEPVKLHTADGREVNMVFTGRGYSRDRNNPLSATIANRPMTWTDVFYLAAMNTLIDKHVYVTRYPLLDYFGTYVTRVMPLSTLKTQPVIIDGIVYKNYPIIDVTKSEDEVTASFIDTVSLSNLFLDAIGGDYDGDQVSLKMVYTQEANQEAEEAIFDIKQFLNIKGDMVRVLGNESLLCMYNMTRH